MVDTETHLISEDEGPRSDYAMYTDVYLQRIILQLIPFWKQGSCHPKVIVGRKFVLLGKSDIIITKDSETPDDIGVPLIR